MLLCDSANKESMKISLLCNLHALPVLGDIRPIRYKLREVMQCQVIPIIE
jgi:hypothetical protein